MDNTVRAFMKRHQLVKKHSTVLIAVSGGPDSMALLHFFCSLRAEWDLRLVAVSADHQLRGEESRQDLNYVEQVCRQQQVEFIGRSLDVPALQQETHMGTQVAARERRYQFFAEQMNTFRADYLALGHHADDQTETMLMSFIHAASVKQLAGIPLERQFASGKIIRPFLCVTKTAIEDYCHKHNIRPRYDPSNDSLTYTRNDYRSRIMPLLKAENRNLHRTTQHLSQSLQDDEAFLAKEASRMAERVVNFDHQRAMAHFDIKSFISYSRSLQRRVFHLILSYLYHDMPKKLSYIHEEQFFTMLNESYGHTRIDFPQHLKLERSYQHMAFYFELGETRSLSYHMLIELPGETVLPNGMSISAEVVSCPDAGNDLIYSCDEAAVALPLHVRTRKPGDRLQWKGLKGRKKVKDIFIDAKIPLNERHTWPVVTDNNDDVLWLPGLKKGVTSNQPGNGVYIQLSCKQNDT